VFERYTEPARRALFFARYEVTQFGGLAIEPEHLLLGVARGGGAAPHALTQVGLSFDTLHADLNDVGDATRERIATSVEIPFSAETHRVLHRAAAEADSRCDRHIGPEHLLLGVLTHPGPVVSAILAKHNVSSEQVRTALLDALASGAAHPVDLPRTTGVLTGLFVQPEAVVAADRIEQMKALVAQLAATDDDAHAAALAARIDTMLDDFKRLLGGR